MNIIHLVRIFAILLIITNKVAFTNAYNDEIINFFRENQKNIFERLRKLEDRDSIKQSTRLKKQSQKAAQIGQRS